VRIVLDTNVVVSTLIWAGTPSKLVQAAIAAEADLLVSGDRHLLALGSHRNIRIVTPAEAARLIAVA
jgi:predicted nucleic acid-binding protein